MVDSEFNYIYIDDQIVVVNKPAGISTIPDGYDQNLPCLSKILETKLGRIWTVHRLNKETSGLLVFARDNRSHRDLNNQFEKRLIHKTYHVLAFGKVTWQSIEVNYPLLIDADRKHRTIVNTTFGKPAVTDFNALRSLKSSYWLIEALPKTGYTHQIRAHLSAIGLQVINDKLYKPRPLELTSNLKPLPPKENFAPLPITRLALHALTMEFKHPGTNETVKLFAPYPDDIEETIAFLEAQ